MLVNNNTLFLNNKRLEDIDISLYTRIHINIICIFLNIINTFFNTITFD